MAETILVAEDDPNIGRLVRTYLERDGFTAIWVRDGEAALAEFPRHPVGLVVLDIGLPGIDGLEVCRRLGGRAPVIMLTARDEIADRVAGLELGADDYLTKPFSPRELTARIRAVLRRAHGDRGPEAALTLGALTISTTGREVRVDGREVELTRREYDLLEYLVRHRGQVVSRDELLAAVWGFVVPGDTRTLDVHVAQLRRKLGAAATIRTVRGVGYKAVA